MCCSNPPEEKEEREKDIISQLTSMFTESLQQQQVEEATPFFLLSVD